MRRLLIEEPQAESAVWSRRLAIFAATVAAISVLLARSGLFDYQEVMSVFAASVLLACMAILMASTGAVVIWKTGRRGVGAIIYAIFVSCLVISYPGYLLAQAIRFPQISDISTDLVSPPTFSNSPRAIAARGGLFHGELSQARRDAQRRGYPEVQPIVLDLETGDAWSLVQQAVAARGWRVIDEISPGGRMGLGHIDAIVRSLVMGLPDDITIRVTPLAGQTRIDVRAASRYGRHDFGENARRIQRFSDELQTQLDNR